MDVVIGNESKHEHLILILEYKNGDQLLKEYLQNEDLIPFSIDMIRNYKNPSVLKTVEYQSSNLTLKVNSNPDGNEISIYAFCKLKFKLYYYYTMKFSESNEYLQLLSQYNQDIELKTLDYKNRVGKLEELSNFVQENTIKIDNKTMQIEDIKSDNMVKQNTKKISIERISNMNSIICGRLMKMENEISDGFGVNTMINKIKRINEILVRNNLSSNLDESINKFLQLIKQDRIFIKKRIEILNQKMKSLDKLAQS